LTYQWLQATAKLAVANVVGIPIAAPDSIRLAPSVLFETTEYTADAILLAHAGIVLLAIGARLATPFIRATAADFARIDPAKLLLVYIPLKLISLLWNPFMGGSMAQFIGTFTDLHLGVICLWFGIWYTTRRGGALLAFIVALELAMGFLSFFSTWKTPLIAGLIMLFAATGAGWRRHAGWLVAGAAAMIFLGTVWTIIKPAYRASMNEGTNQQVNVLSAEEQASALSREVGRVAPDDLAEGFLYGLGRLSYVDFLAASLDTVPREVPHQNGGLWGEAIGHVLMPRLLFPDKPVLPSDSERTMRFTNQVLASDEQGTSISIGYVGESYIDFGVAGALIIPLLLGMFYGAALRALVLLGRRLNPAVLLAFAPPLIWQLQLFEVSNLKLLGNLIWSWISCAVLLLVLWPRIEQFLRSNQTLAVSAAPVRRQRA
jgi:hypothetical protein